MKHVLVVDDDPGVRGLARVILTAAGFHVSLAQNGEDAVAAVRENLPTIMVLDLTMPVMDGRTAFRLLDQEGMRPPTIILSAFQAEAACSELGAEDCLAKPFDPDTLIAKVESLRRS